MKITRDRKDWTDANFRVTIGDTLIDGYEMVFENHAYLRAYLMTVHNMEWNDASGAIRNSEVVTPEIEALPDTDPGWG